MAGGLSAEQAKHLATIRRLIKSNDFADVEQGLVLLDALDDPDLIELITDGLSVDEDGRLVIPAGSEIQKRVKKAYRQDVAFWALSRTDQLQALTTLRLYSWSALQSGDALQGCPSLTTLDLSGCDSLQSVSGLKGLKNLTALDLRRCPRLEGISPKRYHGIDTIHALLSRA